MTKLIATTPCAGLSPLQIGAVTLSEIVIGPMWSVAPLKGKNNATASALGVTLPKPNRVSKTEELRVVWAGHGTYFVSAPSLPNLERLAAVTEQGDGWAALSLSGHAARDVLARLTPLDLRESVFKTGHTARTLIGHMTAMVTRTGRQQYEVMVMRSMAQTLVEEVSQAARHVATRTGG